MNGIWVCGLGIALKTLPYKVAAVPLLAVPTAPRT